MGRVNPAIDILKERGDGVAETEGQQNCVMPFGDHYAGDDFLP